MRKTVIKIFLLTLLIFGLLTTQVFAYKTSSGIEPHAYITIKVNGNIVRTDTPPFLEDGRVFVPVRFVAESLGMDINFDSVSKKVEIICNEDIIEVWSADNKIVVNGNTDGSEAVIQIMNGRTFVPLRTIAENLGVEVKWDPVTLSVQLFKENISVADEYVHGRSYTDEDLLWLSRIVTIETGWQCFDAKLGVANVVLNRVSSSIFPSKIYDVIFDTNYTVQFPTAYYERFPTLEPNAQSIMAAKMALEGINNVENCLYFNYVPFKWKRSDELFAIYDGEYFYR
jgi:N-acetylmuramoyl-L-alanine amidase